MTLSASKKCQHEIKAISSVASPEAHIVIITSYLIECTMLYGHAGERPLIPPRLSFLNLPINPFNLMTRISMVPITEMQTDPAIDNSPYKGHRATSQRLLRQQYGQHLGCLRITFRREIIPFSRSTENGSLIDTLANTAAVKNIKEKTETGIVFYQEK